MASPTRHRGRPMPDAGDSPATDTSDLDALRMQAIRWLASPSSTS